MSITKSNIDNYASSGTKSEWLENQSIYPIESLVFDHYFSEQGQLVLDIGCGGGRTTDFLVRSGKKAIGLDLSPDLIQGARKINKDLSFIQADATNLPFPNNAFDSMVFSCNGVDLIYPEKLRNAAFKEVYRCLKPNGLFYYSSHNILGFFLRNGIPQVLKHPFQMFHFLKNQKKLTLIREGYWRYREGSDDFIYFSKSPMYQVKYLTRCGFESLVTLGTRRISDGNIFGLEQIQSPGPDIPFLSASEFQRTCHHIHYVLKKLP